MPSWTTDTLVSRIKRKALLPESDTKLTDAEVLQIADEEIQTRLYGALMSVRDDYFIAHRELTFPEGARWVQLPQFADSSTLVDVAWVDMTQTPYRYRLLDRRRSGAPWHNATNQINRPFAYGVEGDRLGLIGIPDQDFQLLLRYERRPNRMHLAASGSSCAIASYDPVTLAFTLSAPTTLNESEMAAGVSVDVVRATPAFDALVQGMTVVSVATPVWTIEAGDVDHSQPDTAPITQSDVNVGDYLTVSGETPVFPLPEIWWSPTIYAAAATVCREIGDTNQAGLNDAQAAQLIAQAIQTQSNRIRKQAPIVFNVQSTLRSGPWGWRRIGEDQWGY